jgi:NitT/TauT family transport system permease protein
VKRGGRSDRWLPLVSIALFLIVLGVWHLVVELFDVSFLVLPPPQPVLEKLYRGIESGQYLTHAQSTLLATLFGFTLGLTGGITAGVLVARFPRFGKVVQPFIVAMQSFPKIALAPLFAVIFGYGMTPKVVIGAILAFFPIMVSTVAGFRATNEDEQALMSTLKASATQEFWYVRFPNALPYLFAGVEVAMILALLGTITAEFVGSTEGLGYLLTIRISLLEIDGVYSLLFFFGILGSVLFVLTNALRRRIVFWQEPA